MLCHWLREKPKLRHGRPGGKGKLGDRKCKGDSDTSDRNMMRSPINFQFPQAGVAANVARHAGCRDKQAERSKLKMKGRNHYVAVFALS